MYINVQIDCIRLIKFFINTTIQAIQIKHEPQIATKQPSNNHSNPPKNYQSQPLQPTLSTSIPSPFLIIIFIFLVPCLMYKPKAEQFRKQIRRQYLTSYFTKKRKQFPHLTPPQHNTQQSTIDRLNSTIHQLVEGKEKGTKMMLPETGVVGYEDLVVVAKFTQTEMGIQCLGRTEIPMLVLPYLGAGYVNTKEQHMATCIFANITYLRPQVLPSTQFMRNITNILQNIDIHSQPSTFQPPLTPILCDTIDNCLIIIYNITLQFQQACKFYVEECDLVGLMFKMFENCSGGCTVFTVEKMLKVMNVVTRFCGQGKERSGVRRFLKHYLSVVQNTNQSMLIFLALANIKELLAIYIQETQPKDNHSKQYYSTHPTTTSTTPQPSQTQTQLQLIQTGIQKSRFFQKLTHLYPHISSKKHITRNILMILKMMMPRMERKTVEEKLWNLMNRLVGAVYGKEGTKLQEENGLYPEKEHGGDREGEGAGNGVDIMIKAEFYQIVYVFLQVWPSDHELLTKHPLFAKICEKYEEFEESSSEDSLLDTDTRQCFIHIFGLLAFSGRLTPRLKKLLKMSIEKCRATTGDEFFEKNQKSEDDSTFDAYLEALDDFSGGMESA